MARAWGVLPDELLHIDAGTWRLMLEQLGREADRAEQARQDRGR